MVILMNDDGRNKIVERQRKIDLIEDIVVPLGTRSIVNAPAEIVEILASHTPRVAAFPELARRHNTKCIPMLTLFLAPRVLVTSGAQARY